MVLLYFVGIFAGYLLELSRENKRFPWRAYCSSGSGLRRYGQAPCIWQSRDTDTSSSTSGRSWCKIASPRERAVCVYAVDRMDLWKALGNFTWNASGLTS